MGGRQRHYISPLLHLIPAPPVDWKKLALEAGWTAPSSSSAAPAASGSPAAPAGGTQTIITPPAAQLSGGATVAAPAPITPPITPPPPPPLVNSTMVGVSAGQSGAPITTLAPQQPARGLVIPGIFGTPAPTGPATQGKSSPAVAPSRLPIANPIFDQFAQINQAATTANTAPSNVAAGINPRAAAAIAARANQNTSSANNWALPNTDGLKFGGY